jgi:hypothetical protein
VGSGCAALAVAAAGRGAASVAAPSLQPSATWLLCTPQFGLAALVPPAACSFPMPCGSFRRLPSTAALSARPSFLRRIRLPPNPLLALTIDLAHSKQCPSIARDASPSWRCAHYTLPCRLPQLLPPQQQRTSCRYQYTTFSNCAVPSCPLHTPLSPPPTPNVSVLCRPAHVRCIHLLFVSSQSQPCGSHLSFCAPSLALNISRSTSCWRREKVPPPPYSVFLHASIT